MKLIIRVVGLAVVMVIAGAALWYLRTTLNTNTVGIPAERTETATKAPPAPARGNARATLISSEPVTESVVNDRLTTIGNGKAASSVTVVPLSAGTLTEILVTPGQQINKGDVIARLDSASELIARDRAARTVRNAASTESRLAQLFKTNTASESELDGAKATTADADLALREAELTLARRNVVAPISGVVGLMQVDAGNYVTAQSALATVDDRSTIVVEFWVPESFANQISVGQSLTALALAVPGEIHEGVISAMDSRIDTDSRTLQVEARIANSGDTLRPGMSFEVRLNFIGETYPAVNPMAIQWDSDGSFVWRVVENKAEKVPVVIIQRNPTSVLVNGNIALDDHVIIEGLLALRPGSTVRSQDSGNRLASKGLGNDQ